MSDAVAEAEATLAALPPPTAAQRAVGWSRDWSRAWDAHERQLAATYDGSSSSAKTPSSSSSPWKCRDDVVAEGGGRVMFFDLTGGPTVRLAKERAIAEQAAHERAAVERAREARREALRAERPDVHRVEGMPSATLKTGAKIPLVGLGTWKSEPGKVRDAVETALRCGYTHVDCAAIYENEGEVGQALEKVFAQTRLTREEVFITSKLWNTDHASDKVEVAVRKTLGLLRTTYLDLYLMHWPVTGNRGAVVTPSIKETWQAMEAVVDKGLVKAIGVSNFSSKKLQDIMSYARHPVSVCQVEIHPYWRQERLVAFCRANAIHVTAYSPLGSPDSAAMFKRQTPVLMQDPTVKAIAAKTGKDVGQVLVRWALQGRPDCSVLPKSANSARIRSNLDVLGWRLDEDDMAALDTLANQCRMVDGSFWLSPFGPYKVLSELWDDDDEEAEPRS